MPSARLGRGFIRATQSKDIRLQQQQEQQSLFMHLGAINNINVADIIIIYDCLYLLLL